MDLSKKSAENVKYMVEKIKEKLKVLNFDAIKPSYFSEEWYDELKEIYEMVMRKTRLAQAKCRRSLKN